MTIDMLCILSMGLNSCHKKMMIFRNYQDSNNCFWDTIDSKIQLFPVFPGLPSFAMLKMTSPRPV